MEDENPPEEGEGISYIGTTYNCRHDFLEFPSPYLLPGYYDKKTDHIFEISVVGLPSKCMNTNELSAF